MNIIFEGRWEDLENSRMFNNSSVLLTPEKMIEIIHSDGSIKTFTKAIYVKDHASPHPSSRLWVSNDYDLATLSYSDRVELSYYNGISLQLGTLKTVRVYPIQARVLKISEALGPHTVAAIVGIVALINSYL